MKRAIAMKCSQEQFDEIEGKIPKKYLKTIGDFKDSYLINNWCGVENQICTMYKNGASDSYYGRVLHETWNEQIFLEACGIEVEKVEYQIFRCGSWTSTDLPIRIKPTYKKEIENIESLAKEIGYKVILEKL